MTGRRRSGGVGQEYLDHLRVERGLAPRTLVAYGRDMARLDSAVLRQGFGIKLDGSKMARNLLPGLVGPDGKLYTEDDLPYLDANPMLQELGSEDGGLTRDLLADSPADYYGGGLSGEGGDFLKRPCPYLL